MARQTSQKKQGIIWIPPVVNNPCCKIEIITDAGTQNVSDYLISAVVNLGITESISTAELILSNPNRVLNSLFTFDDILEVSFGYDSVYYKKFSGKINSIFKIFDNGGFSVAVSAKDYAQQFIDKFADEAYESYEVSKILTDTTNGLIPVYSTDITTTNVQTTDETITKITFKNKKVFECIKELANKVGYNFFVDVNKVANFIKEGSVTSETEACVESQNILRFSLGSDTSEIFNKVKVLGRVISDDVFFLNTINDTTSQSLYDTKETIFNDYSIDNMNELSERANYEINLTKDLTVKGNLTCFGMPTLNQGEMIRVSSPNNAINGTYIPKRITHRFDARTGYLTDLQIETSRIDTVKILKDTRMKELSISTENNVNRMTDAFTLSFTDDSNVASFGNTQITEGSLVLKSGQTTGVMQTSTLSIDYSPTYCELRIVGESLNDCSFQVSFNNGLNYQAVTNKNVVSIINSGATVILKATLNSNANNPVPKLDGIAILFKR